MVIKCSRCGFINNDTVNFCINCGNELLIENSSAINSHQNNLEWLAEQLYENNISLPIDNCPVILKKTETPIIVLPNITFKEPRSVRTSIGGYAGPTIKIAKGISFRLGGTSSKSVSHEEIKEIDKGTLTITNKRLIFTGQIKTLNYNLNKILSINEFKDAISIQRENKQKTEYFANLNKIIINYEANNKIISTPFYGSLLKATIMGQIV